jgi:hypothetical protein
MRPFRNRTTAQQLLDELDTYLMQASYDEAVNCFIERAYAGQTYVCTAVEPHIRGDGFETNFGDLELALRPMRCAVRVQEIGTCSAFMPSRRCAAHKRPGVRVKAR